MRASLLAAAASLALAAPSAVSFCFPRGFGDTDSPICLSWERQGPEVLFAVNCTPDSYPEFSLGWCAFGVSTATPAGSPLPSTWGMWPAEVFHLQVTLGSPPTVVLTDRLTTGVRMPACMPTQESRLLNATVDAKTGVLTAFFTRKAHMSQKLLAEGYTSLNRTLPLIAAISNNEYPHSPIAGCEGSFPPHDNQWNNQTAAF